MGTTRRAHAQSPQTDQFASDEALAIYHTNLARRAAGVPPLRWNQELAQAARQFAWDSVENHEESECGHIDSQERTMAQRIVAAGYTDAKAWAENVACSYLSPEEAVAGWLGSSDHRANLLNAEYREIGMGYYRTTDGRGYVVQNLARDGQYAPVIIENEALATETAQVNLYIYNRPASDGFAGMDAATEMMIANDASFTGAVWEPFAHEKVWTLQAGEGWRTVYIKLRDGLQRTTLAHDTIYLGANVPTEQVTLRHASTVMSTVSAADVRAQVPDAVNWPTVQFSLNWLADDSHANFDILQGVGEPVADGAAVGGTAHRLAHSPELTYAWMWSSWLALDEPVVAFVRLKVADNQSPDPVLQFSIDDGTTVHGPLEVRGTDFEQPGQYQEFALPFTATPGEVGAALALHFYHLGTTDVYVDSVTFFTQPMPLTDTLSWSIPSAAQRGRSVWARSASDSTTTAWFELYPPLAVDAPIQVVEAPPVTPSPAENEVEGEPAVIVAEPEMEFSLRQNETALAQTTAHITCANCNHDAWSVSSDAEWLSADRNAEQINIQVSAAGLEPGTYHGTVTVNAAPEAGASSAHIATTLNVTPANVSGSDVVAAVYLPIAKR